ncbi:MAG: hypothetical protein SGJ27_25360 [Candidatus Melainabacteria bacterium]|nr:hypothetical protein [Candidatus Melainabacteria bacterium]
MKSNASKNDSPLSTAWSLLNDLRKKHRWLIVPTTLATILMSAAISLSAYLLIWGVVYRFPHSSPLIVDARNDKTERPHYVAICAALAANRHGFPGHAYVAWSDSLPLDLEHVESLGFVPMSASDQIPSLWRVVPGALVDKAADGNKRNLNAVIVVVDSKTFELSKAKCKNWKSDQFKVGSSDCVAFARSVATSLGLETPESRYRYPQDYVAQLKILNQKSANLNICNFRFVPCKQRKMGAHQEVQRTRSASNRSIH